MEPKHLKSVTLYNKLQDLRHIVMFDYRDPDQYAKSHIRDSQLAAMQSPQWEIRRTLDLADKKYADLENKYKTKRIRRVVLIGQPSLQLDGQVVQKWAQRLSAPEFIGYHLLVLKDDYSVFQDKYHFLCISNKQVYPQKLAEDQRSKSVSLTQYERAMLYSLAKFPTELLEGSLYLGDIFNSNNQEQLKDLKIRTLIDFVAYEEGEQLPQFKKQYNYIHIPMHKGLPLNVNFDGVNKQIQEAYQTNQGPIMMYCRDGNEFTPAFAIAYLMMVDKKPFQVCSLKVFQALSSAEICKWLYTQITTYNPKPTD